MFGLARSNARIASDHPEAQSNVSREFEEKLAEIERELRTANMWCVHRAKLVGQWAHQYEQGYFRQNVGKRLGRPPSLVQLMVERLEDAVPGKSPEAQKKWIERALKIAGLTDEVPMCVSVGHNGTEAQMELTSNNDRLFRRKEAARDLLLEAEEHRISDRGDLSKCLQWTYLMLCLLVAASQMTSSTSPNAKGTSISNRTSASE
jgi:hypothetical protein